MTEVRPYPRPGWYPDPGGSGMLRWWDGAQWTGHLRSGWDPAAGFPPAPDPPGESAARSRLEGRPGFEPPLGQRQPPGPIPARALWWAVVGIAAGEVIGGVFALATYGLTGSATGVAATLAGELGLWAGMAGSCVFVSRRYGTASLRADFGLALKASDLGVGFLAALSGLVVAALVGSAFAHTHYHGSNTQILTGQKHHTAGFVAVAVVVAVGAPFFEELFFRGLIRTALASRLGPVGAVFAQAALFGLAHFQAGNGLGNVSVIAVIASLGLVLGFTAWLTKRLGAGMVCHGLFNLVAVVTVITA